MVVMGTQEARRGSDRLAVQLALAEVANVGDLSHVAASNPDGLAGGCGTGYQEDGDGGEGRGRRRSAHSFFPLRSRFDVGGVDLRLIGRPWLRLT